MSCLQDFESSGFDAHQVSRSLRVGFGPLLLSDTSTTCIVSIFVRQLPFLKRLAVNACDTIDSFAFVLKKCGSFQLPAKVSFTEFFYSEFYSVWICSELFYSFDDI